MPINTYNAMGNNRYGELTDAERLAAQQEQAALTRAALDGGRARSTGPARTKDPEGFTLMQALMQAAQAARGQAQTGGPSGSEGGGPLVGPGRGQSDAQESAEQRMLRVAREREIRQAIDENRTRSPDEIAHNELLEAMRGPTMRISGPLGTWEAPRRAGEHPIRHIGGSSSAGTMIRPQRPAAYAGNVDPEERRTQALLDQQNVATPEIRAATREFMANNQRGTQPNPGMEWAAERRRKLYEDAVFGGGAKTEDAILMESLKRRAAEAKAGDGDFAGAAGIVQSGELPGPKPVALVSPDVAAQGLAAAAAAFGERDDAMAGWDPDANDVNDLFQRRDEMVEAIMRAEPRADRAQAVQAANRILMDALAPHAKSMNTGWVRQVIQRIRSESGAAPAATPGRTGGMYPSFAF